MAQIEWWKNFIVSLGLQANFLPDGFYYYRLLFWHLSWGPLEVVILGTGKKKNWLCETV
jgi:hypothetical protein